MFVQVIKGRTKDSDGVRRQMDRWQKDIRPDAIGYLGSTAGVAADGTLIVFARFSDAAAAAKNSARPEQGTWWEETSKLFDDEPTFRESSDVTTMLDGDFDAAGFVQVMEGSVTDRAKAEAFETGEMLEQLRKARPDLLGSMRVWFDGGTFTEASYFTSEAERRRPSSPARSRSTWPSTAR
jgi:hypothetical protein